MRIDLTKNEYKVFAEDYIEFNEGITLIFGKNGVGKSTLTKIIKEQMSDNYDVREFSGFDNILNINGDLDIVILGDENVKIDKMIKEIEKERESIQNEIDKCKYQLDEENQDKNSIMFRYKKCKKNKENAEECKESIISKIAAKIKNESNPQISQPTYNKNNLKEEIKLLNELNDNDNKNYLINKVKEDLKIAKDLYEFDDSIIEQLKKDVNSIITKNISERIKIDRFEGENKEEKIKYALNGLKLHKPGDKCIFCGNYVNKYKYDELVGYFKQSDIENEQKNLNELEGKIKNVINEIDNINIIKDNFYLQYNNEIIAVDEELQLYKKEAKEYLTSLNQVVLEKNKNLTKIFKEVNKKLDVRYEAIKNKYNKVKNENNSNDLFEEKEEAKKKLRLMMIKTMLDSTEYVNAEKQCVKFDIELTSVEKELNEEQKILDDKINQLKTLDLKIVDFNRQTQNPGKIKDKINNVLDIYVNFKLDYAKLDNKGSYFIVDKNETVKKRNVKEISTGEKNIVAFLYFLFKLDEKTDNIMNKIIIFDDPMNSNDDVMQYIIMENLVKLLQKNEDKFKHKIIMTHNTHFFLNIKEQLRIEDKDKKINILENMKYFIKTENGTIIKKLTNNDIKTAYDELWYELKILCEVDDANSPVMANSMRRIVDTFTSFVKVNKMKFYNKVSGAKKIFDINSHSGDPTSDIDADLLPMSKEELLNIFKELFEKNGYLDHFNEHFK